MNGNEINKSIEFVEGWASNLLRRHLVEKEEWVWVAFLLVGYGRPAGNGSAERKRTQPNKLIQLINRKERECRWRKPNNIHESIEDWWMNLLALPPPSNGAPRRKTAAVSEWNQIKLFFLPLKREEKLIWWNAFFFFSSSLPLERQTQFNPFFSSIKEVDWMKRRGLSLLSSFLFVGYELPLLCRQRIPFHQKAFDSIPSLLPLLLFMKRRREWVCLCVDKRD